jgi:hypothetical protein
MPYHLFLGKFFCCNNNVSNLYNNSVVEKINGMAYIFTLLMFRKLNKRTTGFFFRMSTQVKAEVQLTHFFL